MGSVSGAFAQGTGEATCDDESCTLPVGFVEMAKQVWAEGGIAALFTGWSAAVCRAFPANAGLFAGVELMSRLLKDV